MDYGLFNMRTDINAFDCTQGCTDTIRESALKVDSRRKTPCCTGESNNWQWQQHAGLTLCQLSYIPTHCGINKQRASDCWLAMLKLSWNILALPWNANPLWPLPTHIRLSSVQHKCQTLLTGFWLSKSAANSQYYTWCCVPVSYTHLTLPTSPWV